MNPNLLDRHEAAKYLDVCVRTLDSWRADGRYIPFLKYAGQVRYRREDLDTFLEENTRKVACQ